MTLPAPSSRRVVIPAVSIIPAVAASSAVTVIPPLHPAVAVVPPLPSSHRCRHPRESGDPVSSSRAKWIPAFAGTTVLFNEDRSMAVSFDDGLFDGDLV
ncbi:MAG: hypothetical protein KA124_04730 [Luteimonas sp.]|nr:hypothetical protein [Luteimonas sp.]